MKVDLKQLTFHDLKAELEKADAQRLHLLDKLELACSYQQDIEAEITHRAKISAEMKVLKTDDTIN